MGKPFAVSAPALAVLTVVVASVACGSPPIPIGPPSASSVLAADKAPLVVDWPAGQRTDLETATSDGVAVVRVEPAKITLLRDCRLPGSYGFLGVSTKEQLIRLDDAADVSVSLPLRGAGLAADLGGELGSAVALDVALVTVGRRRTTRAAALRSALKGSECRGATHFVRGFDVGAFVLATSEKTSLSTVAGLFGAKASYARKGAKAVRETDGALDACRTADPKDKAPPAQCGAALRLDLKALDEDETVEDASCGSGLVRASGKCTSATKVPKKTSYECSPSNDDECREQCDLGDAASCGHLALSLRHSTTKAPDFKATRAIAERGCTGGSERACVVLGELLQYGNGVTVDMKAAGDLYDRACTAGEASGCFRQGTLYDRRPGLPVDWKKAAELYDRSCRGGYADGCNNLGALALAGRGMDAAPERARSIYEDACKNGSAAACGNLGDLVADGIGGPKDTARAADLWTQACSTKSGAHCIRLGDATSGMGPLAKDTMRSVEAYQRGMKLLSTHCNLGIADRCDDLGWLFHDGRAVPRDDEQALVYVRKGCELGSPAACNHVGMFLEHGWGTTKNVSQAKTKYKEVCDAGNLYGCVSVALLETGNTRNDLLKRACDGGVTVGCYHLARAERAADAGGLAKPRMEKACQQGHAAACSYLGRWLVRDGRRTDGQARLETGCSRGDIAGCASLAELLSTSKSDAERAETLARRACEGGAAQGCRTLSEMAARGLTRQVNSSDGNALMQKACDGRDLAACVTLGERAVSSEPGRAASLYSRACEVSSFSNGELTKAIESHVIARKEMAAPETAAGLRLSERGLIAGAGGGLGSLGAGALAGGGTGSTAGGSGGSGGGGSGGSGRLLRARPGRDPREIARANDRSDAAEGNVDETYAGCVALGQLHERGIGFTADAARAGRYYGAACAYGDGRGCSSLAALEERQKSKDKTKIAALYDRACDLDDAEGCLKAGVLAESSKLTGELARIVGEASVSDFERACELDSAEGCVRAADKLASREPETAQELYEKACSLKITRACDAGAKLEKRIAASRPKPAPAPEPGGIHGDVQLGAATTSTPIPDAPRALASLRARFRNCYERELRRDPTMTGKIVFGAKVGQNGEVLTTSVMTNSGLSPGVAQCATEMLKRTKFSAPAADSTLTFPATFVTRN